MFVLKRPKLITKKDASMCWFDRTLREHVVLYGSTNLQLLLLNMFCSLSITSKTTLNNSAKFTRSGRIALLWGPKSRSPTVRSNKTRKYALSLHSHVVMLLGLGLRLGRLKTLWIDWPWFSPFGLVKRWKPQGLGEVFVLFLWERFVFSSWWFSSESFWINIPLAPRPQATAHQRNKEGF